MDINHHKTLEFGHKPYFVDVDDDVREFYIDNYKALKLDTKRVYISRTYTSEYEFRSKSSNRPTKTLKDLIRDIGPKEKKVKELQKNSIFQYTGGQGTGFTTGKYYMQRKTSRYIYPVIDDLGSNTNGFTGDDWRGKAILCETEPVKEWEEGYTYMCIAIPKMYGKFTVGKTYKTRKIKGNNVYRIICEDDTAWDIHKDRHKRFVKIKGSRVATTEVPADDRVKFPVGALVNVDSLDGSYVVESWDYRVDKMDVLYKLQGLTVEYKEDRLTLAGDWDTKTLFSKGQFVQLRGDRKHVYTVWATDIQKFSDPLKEDLIRYELTRDDGEVVVHPEPMLMPYVEVEEERTDEWEDEVPEESLPYTWEQDIPFGYEEDKIRPTGKIATVYVFNNGIKRPFEGTPTSWKKDMDSITGKIYKDVALSVGDNYTTVYIPKDNETNHTWAVRPDKYVIVKYNGSDDWDDPQAELPEVEPVPVKLKDISVKEEMKMMFPLPCLLAGDVGVGKSTIVMELAKELDLEYCASVITDQTSKNEFTGYKNAMNGEYVQTEFRRIYTEGGLYNLEEINAGQANLAIIFNTIENGYFVFADKICYAHENFRLVATMNEITNAKDFGGRRELDKSVRDRFHKIKVTGDINSRFNPVTVAYSKAVNDVFEKKGISDKISHRDMARFEKMIQDKTVSTEKAIQKTMINNKVKLTDKELTKLKKEGAQWK